jgi:hypothetical protein
MKIKILTEMDNRRRNVIRTLVRDIIKLYKIEEEGEFYLPNYIDENEDFYNFPGFSHDIVLQVSLEIDDNVEDYKLNGDYWRDEDIIEINIKYNPNVKEQITYDLVGDLNELIGHEIRHIDQKTKSLYNLYTDEPDNPFEYYMQPHEIDAQVFGFKRLERLSKKPFESLVRRWFERNKDIHQLTDSEVEIVINEILKHK